MDTYLYDSKEDCVANGHHSTVVDEDGFCNYCGFEPVEEDEEG